MKKTIIILVVLVVVVIGIYLMTSNNKSKVDQVSAPTTQTSDTNLDTISDTTSNVVVNMKNLAFNPQVVKIKAGTKVTWVNNDSMAHTVTSNTDNLLNSATLSPGESFSFTFTNTGMTNYHCNIHKTMIGIVIVE